MLQTTPKTRRQCIMESAAHLFRKQGYTATSMRDLAKAVGVEAASLYNHIKSKQLILQELLMHIAARFTAGMEEIDSQAISPFEKIRKLITLHVQITTEETDAVALLTQDWRHLEEPVFSEFDSLRSAYEGRFKHILVEGMNKGELVQINPDIALFSILSTMRWLYSWYSENPNMSPVDLETQIFDCVIVGLKR